MSDPLVSVIVISKNSARYIERCLDSIEAQTYKNLELVVVDNFSTDNTVEIARHYTDKVISSGPERSPQANIGVNAARGEWIYIVGSDFVLQPTIIAEAVEQANNTGAEAVITMNHSDATVSRWARARAFERAMYAGDDLNVAARFIKRARYLEVGGYDESLIAGEDYDLQLRLLAAGVEMARTSAYELHIGEPKTLIEVIKKHYFYGHDLRKYVAKNGKQTVKQLSPIRPAFIRNYKEFLKHPADAALFFAYMVAKYVSGGLGWIFGGRDWSSKYRRIPFLSSKVSAN